MDRSPRLPHLYRPSDCRRELEFDWASDKPEHEFRSSFRRDYGRLIHCNAFRRLIGKTQLFPGIESDFFRNRLTHSLEVAQIARSIALRLNHEESALVRNPIDTDVVEVAGLAHDPGHPPFGHTGEHALNICMLEHGGFEGNAQTLRILARLEKKATTDPEGIGITGDGEDRRYGLNLTFRSLAGVLKYDHMIPRRSRSRHGIVKG